MDGELTILLQLDHGAWGIYGYSVSKPKGWGTREHMI